MARLVKFNRSGDPPVWVNPEYVMSVTAQTFSGSYLDMAEGHCVAVVESPGEVVEALAASGELS